MRAASRHLLVIPCIALVSLAAACGGAGSASPPTTNPHHKSATPPKGHKPPKQSSTTSSTTTLPAVSAPTTSIPTTGGRSTLEAIKWTSVSVPADVCPGRTRSIQLSDGKATIPAPAGVDAPQGVTVAAGRPVFGDLYGPGHDVAALNVWCSRAKGTAAGQLENSWVLYTDASSKVVPLTTLLPTQPSNLRAGVHVPYFDTSKGAIVIVPGKVTVHELWYKPNNATCCPSEHVTTVWRAHGTSFSSYTAITG